MGILDKIFAKKNEEETEAKEEKIATPSAAEDTEAESPKPAPKKSRAGAHDFDAIVTIASNGELYVPANVNLPVKWPAIDMNGYIHAYTDLEYAQTRVKPETGFELLTMSGHEFCASLSDWQRFGIVNVRLISPEKTAEFTGEELGLEKGFNSDLQFMIIRFLQGANSTSENLRIMAKTWWSALCHMIPDTFFFVPICYEGEDLKERVDDHTMHVFPKAAERIRKLQEQGKTPVIAGYPYAEKAEPRTMHFRTLANTVNNEEWLSVYTSLNELLPIWENKAHFALALWDDIKNDYKPTKGILINPLGVNFRLLPESIATIETERYERPKLFVPRSAEDKWAKGTPDATKKYPVSLLEKISPEARPSYVVMELPNGIFLQLMDFGAKRFAQKDITNEKGYSLALFRITEEEAKWVTESPEKFDELAGKLYDRIPKDRYVKAAFLDNGSIKDILITPLCDSIDE